MPKIAQGASSALQQGRPQAILLLTTRYSTGNESPSMIDEIAEALAGLGHKVSVVSLRWNDGATTPRRFDQNGVEVLEIGAGGVSGLGRLVQRATKWALSSFVAAHHAETHFGGRAFDLIVAFAPTVTLAGLVGWARRRFNATLNLHITDLFPFAHRDLGLVPAGLIFQAALRAETRLMRMFDMIGCMSPANAGYLRTRYRIRPEQPIRVLPIWGPTEAIANVDVAKLRARFSIPRARPICIFGGQLSEGRGIEEILAAATAGLRCGSRIVFVIIGAGRLRTLVERHVRTGGDNVILLEPIPREDYLCLAASCDVGLVVTVPNTDVPTFPSRTIDYLRAGLPIVASVERTTDYGAFIEDRKLGVAIEAGNPERLLQAIDEVLGEPVDKDARFARAQEALTRVFSVEDAALSLLSQASSTEAHIGRRTPDVQPHDPFSRPARDETTY